jgi:Flp pilus assembly protein TadG
MSRNLNEIRKWRHGSSVRASGLHASGQACVILTLAMVVLIGAIGLGTDLAVFYYNWTRLQAAADSAATAGANYLPNDLSTAAQKAKDFATSNGIVLAEITAPIFSNSNTTITVKITRTVPYMFLRVLGLTTGQVKASSSATLAGPPRTIGGTIGGPGGTGAVSGVCGTSTRQYNILPIAVDNKTAAQWQQGSSYVLNRKVGTNSNNGSAPWPDAPGNWGTVNLCQGNGVRTAIANGFYGPITIGQKLQTQTGQQIGNIKNGFQDRLSSADHPSSFAPTDPRAVIVPLVDFSSCSGTCDVPVTGFMAFYLDSWQDKSDKGAGPNNTDGAVIGTFIRMVTGNSSADASVTGDAGVQADPVLTN